MTNAKARTNVEARKCAVQFDDASPVIRFIIRAFLCHSSFGFRHSSPFVIRLPRRSAAKAGALSFFLLVVWTSQEGMIIVTR
jgi:hypothetical protein